MFSQVVAFVANGFEAHAFSLGNDRRLALHVNYRRKFPRISPVKTKENHAWKWFRLLLCCERRKKSQSRATKSGNEESETLALYYFRCLTPVCFATSRNEWSSTEPGSLTEVIRNQLGEHWTWEGESERWLHSEWAWKDSLVVTIKASFNAFVRLVLDWIMIGMVTGLVGKNW